MQVTFLGTSSGGGPTYSRNCSSLVADVLGNGSLWMVDCAEGTVRQFACKPHGHDSVKTSKVTKMFITHMHADHVMGIIPFLRNILFAPPVGAFAVPSGSSGIQHARIEIFGPAGIRTFVRSIMKMTLSNTSDKYVVHELLNPEDEVTPCDPSDVLHSSELPGRDILCSEDGFWKAFTHASGVFGDVFMDAGPISHRDPCLGFVVRESVDPFRKIVILGDTYDPSAIIPLCTDPSPSLLIHEATDAHIPLRIDPKARRSLEVVTEKALSRGHSTPYMAGAFARTIGAEKLVLNHIGARFPAPNYNNNSRSNMHANVMQEIERQASEAWGMGPARAAWDFMTVGVPAPDAFVQSYQEQQGYQHQQQYQHAYDVDVKYADPAEGFVYTHQRKRRR